MGQITELIARAADGDEQAANELASVVYQQLKSLAYHHLARSGVNPSSTLSPTSLVNETYLKLISGGQLSVKSRTHFFAIAAKAMRHIIIDYFKAKSATKRSALVQELTEDSLPSPGLNALDILVIEESLKTLDCRHPKAALAFECRFFAGYSIAQTADILGVPIRTCERLWKQAQDFIEESGKV